MTYPRIRKPRKTRIVLQGEEQAKKWKIESTTLYLQQLGYEVGLGEGIREFQFAKCLKRRYAADLAWPGHKILLELEGGVYSNGRHVRGKGYEDDCEKYSLASILGYTLIRVTYGMIETGKALELIQMAANKKLTKGA
jgi:very-short-patch-repair endonuclease